MSEKQPLPREDRLLDWAQQIEERAAGDHDKSSPDQKTRLDQAPEKPGDHDLDEADIQELARFREAIAFLDDVREKIKTQENRSSVDISADPTVREKNEAREDTAALPPAKDASSKLPAQIGRFAIRKVLGQGGFARVFLAHDPQLDRLVAIKVPRPSFLLSEEARARFRREGRAAAVLSHPNIVPVFETGSVGPVDFIVSAYCPGPALDQWFASQQRNIPVRLAASIVARLAEAVQHAHQRGVIHRDLKPGNVLLESPETATASNQELIDGLRITDFGLARVEHFDDQTLTTEGAIVGTPAYMSPEQARGDRQIDATTDVYSLGVLLYELLSGTLPHAGDSHLATLRAVEDDEPLPPGKRRSGIPRDLEAICLKAMSKRTTDRYATSHHLASDLQCWLDGQPVVARKIGSVQRMARWTRRNPALGAALVFALVSLSGGLIATGWQWQKSLNNLAMANDQMARADRHLARMEKNVDEVLVEISVTLRDSPGMHSLRHQVLQKVLQIQKELISEEVDSPLVQSRTAQAYLRIAEIQLMLGNPSESRASVASAMQLIGTPQPGNEFYDDFQVLLAELQLHECRLLFSEYRYGEAIPRLQATVTMVEDLNAREFPVEVLQLKAESNRMLGIALEKARDYEGAERAYLASLEVETEMAGASKEHANDQNQSDMDRSFHQFSLLNTTNWPRRNGTATLSGSCGYSGSAVRGRAAPAGFQSQPGGR